MIRKTLILLYGIFAYLVALYGQIWFIFYIGDWDFMQHTINDPQRMPTLAAIAVDAALVLLFGLQHSVMARRWFKVHLTRYLPRSAERSTYVLLSGIVFIMICLWWQPIDGYLWRVESGPGWYILTAGYLFGWLFSVVATFVINHFELFGLQQVWLQLLDKPEPQNTFSEKRFYRFVRHPIQLGVLIGIWFTPMMTYGHLLLSVLFTLYIMIGLKYEERDLEKELGGAYRAYMQRVGFLFPRRKGRG
jgi:protein-S-isoprenylcysteine O-methyltransferase Ste14